MRYGICTGPENLVVAEQAGFDYVEFTLNQVAGWSDEAFLSVSRQVAASGIKVEACNGFFPWDMRVVGPEADFAAITDYVRKALPRAAQLGVKTTVVGNGGARRIPEDMSPAQGRAQFLEVLRLIGEEAGKAGITAVVEPLNSRETNFILSLAEGAEIVNAVHHPHVRLLADFYHMRMDGEPMAALAATKDLLHHVHIANSHQRVYPMARDEDLYDAFFEALYRIGYDGRVSIEAGTEDMAADSVRALDMLRGICA